MQLSVTACSDSGGLLTGTSDRLVIPAFYKEAARILRPGGTIALFCYDIWDFPDEPKATEVMRRYFDEVRKPYWHANWQFIRGHYKGAEPFSIM